MRPTLAILALANGAANFFRSLFSALVLAFGMAFLISKEERVLKGPATPAASAPNAPATPIPAE